LQLNFAFTKKKSNFAHELCKNIGTTELLGFTSSFLDCASALALSRLTQAWIFASSL